jgi:hypothetical protein
MMGNIQQQISKIKGISDIIFCIDKSGSMGPCIGGVKNNINNFINAINTFSPNLKIDWKIGFCSYDNETFDILDFTNDTLKFSSLLSSVTPGGNEFTAGAIDFCITYFKWREVSNRFLLVFTDEPMEGGWYFEESKAKFPELLRKIMENHIYLHFLDLTVPFIHNSIRYQEQMWYS